MTPIERRRPYERPDTEESEPATDRRFIAAAVDAGCQLISAALR
ncbi:hypothetical protein AB0B85_00780 [Micromonospora sp. NPDC049044]